MRPFVLDHLSMMRDTRSNASSRSSRSVPHSARLPRTALAAIACFVASAGHAATPTASGASGDLASIETRLAQNPSDAQLQFKRGVALSAAGRTADAIVAFKLLIGEHPELAAAYNNLAALQADQGDDDDARALLQKAVQLKPGYATALHNLGDVHLRLAAAAYSQAATSDPGDTLARSRVASLRTWMDERTPATSRTPTSPAYPSLVQLPSSAAAVMQPAPVAPVAKATSLPAAHAAAASDASTSDVSAIVRNWADDWSRRDATAYLGYYAPDFKGRAASHAAWQADRAARVTRPKHIQVVVDEVVVSVIGSSATAHFRQRYTSDALTSVDKKVLTLVRNPAGRWLITGESVDK